MFAFPMHVKTKVPPCFPQMYLQIIAINYSKPIDCSNVQILTGNSRN